MATEIDLKSIPKQRGTMILNEQGVLLDSSGSLEGNELIAQNLFNMIVDTNGLLMKSDSFKRITVAYPDSEYIMTISQNQVLIVHKSL